MPRTRPTGRSRTSAALEHRDRAATSALIDVEDRREATAKRLSATADWSGRSDDLANVAERAWHAVLKAG